MRNRLRDVVLNTQTLAVAAACLLAPALVAAQEADHHGCAVTAEVSAELRMRVVAACADGLRRMEARMGIAADPLPIRIQTFGSAAPADGDSVFVIRLDSMDGVEEAEAGGLVQHELGHLAVIQWLIGEGGPVADTAGYSTLLPDVLDDGLAILAQPPASRAVFRQWLPRFEPPSLREVWDLQHPSVADPPAGTVLSTGRDVYEPCALCDPPFHPSRWVVIEEIVRRSPGGTKVTTVDTTYWSREPVDPGISSTTRFYTLSDALIEFLEQQLDSPARLREFVLAVARLPDQQRHGVVILRELGRSVGQAPAALEEQWADWVRGAAKEAAEELR